MHYSTDGAPFVSSLRIDFAGAASETLGVYWSVRLITGTSLGFVRLSCKLALSCDSLAFEFACPWYDDHHTQV